MSIIGDIFRTAFQQSPGTYFEYCDKNPFGASAREFIDRGGRFTPGLISPKNGGYTELMAVLIGDKRENALQGLQRFLQQGGVPNPDAKVRMEGEAWCVGFYTGEEGLKLYCEHGGRRPDPDKPYDFLQKPAP